MDKQVISISRCDSYRSSSSL